MSTTLPFGDGTIQYKRTVLNAAEVEGMFTTPVEVVPKPGLDGAVVIHNCSVELDYIGPVFSGGGDLKLVYHFPGSPEGLAAQKISADFVRRGADYMITVPGTMNGFVGLPQNTVLHNAPVMLTNEGAPFVGNCRLVVHVWYTNVRTV